MSGQPAGSVYHPVYGEAIAADHRLRSELIRRLRQKADASNTTGDGQLRVEDWDGANRCWSYAARCIRTAQAIGGAKPVDPDDYALISLIWPDVAEWARQQKEGS